MMKIGFAAAIIGAVLSASVTVFGDGEATQAVTAGSFDPTKLEAGARVRVTGKYKELLDKELRLFDCDVTFLLQQKETIKRVLDFKAQRDNVIVTGRLATTDAGPTVEVDDVAPAPSDLEVFTSEADVLRSGSPTDKKGLPGLVKRILAACERFNERDLIPLALHVFNESLGGEGEKLDSAALEDRLRTVREMHRILKDTSVALEAALSLERRSGDHQHIEELLQELNCRKHSGKWMTYAELKRLEGFVEQNGRWITPREKHLLDSIEALRAQKQPNLILRKRTDREYQFLSEKGALEEGMKPEEVCVALGFPDRVERRTFEGKELDQWCYGEKFCYFYGGILMKKPDP